MASPVRRKPASNIQAASRTLLRTRYQGNMSVSRRAFRTVLDLNGGHGAGTGHAGARRVVLPVEFSMELREAVVSGDITLTLRRIEFHVAY
jgi:hypothetical protein